MVSKTGLLHEFDEILIGKLEKSPSGKFRVFSIIITIPGSADFDNAAALAHRLFVPFRLSLVPGSLDSHEASRPGLESSRYREQIAELVWGFRIELIF